MRLLSLGVAIFSTSALLLGCGNPPQPPPGNGNPPPLLQCESTSPPAFCFPPEPETAACSDLAVVPIQVKLLQLPPPQCYSATPTLQCVPVETYLAGNEVPGMPAEDEQVVLPFPSTGPYAFSPDLEAGGSDMFGQPYNSGITDGQGQVVSSAGSGYYGYREDCTAWIADVFLPKAPNPDYNAFRWAAGAFNLPGSINQGAEPYSPVGAGIGEDAEGTTTTSIPALKEDCENFQETVTLYQLDVNISASFRQIFVRSAHGSWNTTRTPAQCDIVSDKSNWGVPIDNPTQQCNAAGSVSDDPPLLCWDALGGRLYRFAVQTKLRDSFQDTSLILWQEVVMP